MVAEAQAKAWWQSKTVWLNVLLTAAGVGTYFAIPQHTPELTLPSVAMALVGVVNVALRVWFTDTPVEH